MTSTKTRNQSPAVALRKMKRSVMKRANVIAINAHNAHNTSIEKIISFGASTGMREFLSIAMTIAWQEQKLGMEIYSMIGKLPRKSLPRIHTALKNKVNSTKPNYNYNLQSAKNFLAQAKIMIEVRNAGKENLEEIQQADNLYLALRQHENSHEFYANHSNPVETGAITEDDLVY
jgi:3'-phosphoadenosine 5'-phosphosulfate sulfotransferase